MSKNNKNESANPNLDNKQQQNEYKVAEGKAITTRKGILSDGDVVVAKDVAGGEETLKNLLEKGFVK
ncbi:hypothetical protein [Francisella philomiragia]|uniref:Uncharacterized protein n=1 Tax=Francisella philomiragia TaxID=28110 RepID=A0ABS1GC68_9GAMM|nr:hypothetical protein [Francisella philomiragia]MBK2258730.1 hypothetical protein [Francisella philomiragia]MBK2302421.1 hypothetical protein [Francisella philomiragia]